MNEQHSTLILAVSRMRSGVCVAGLTRDPAAPTGARWVRPVKPYGTLLPGDICYADGTLMRVGDLVGWHLGPQRPDPPHSEDVLIDPVRERAVLIERLEPARLGRFCAAHLDPDPDAVLIHETRSLCLVAPRQLDACWSRDPYSGHYEARMRLTAGSFQSPAAGLPVTDLAWRALGRRWMGEQPRLELGATALRARLGEIFVTIGLSRTFEGHRWPLIVGVQAALPELVIDVTAL